MDGSFAPLALTTQSARRNMGDEGIMRPAPLNPGRRPTNVLRHGVSMSSLQSTQSTLTVSSHVSTVSHNPSHAPIPGTRVVQLAREAMRLALAENTTKTAEASGDGPNVPVGGITIDLSHRQIQEFPDAVVDVIKDDIER